MFVWKPTSLAPYVLLRRTTRVQLYWFFTTWFLNQELFSNDVEIILSPSEPHDSCKSHLPIFRLYVLLLILLCYLVLVDNYYSVSRRGVCISVHLPLLCPMLTPGEMSSLWWPQVRGMSDVPMFLYVIQSNFLHYSILSVNPYSQWNLIQERENYF